MLVDSLAHCICKDGTIATRLQIHSKQKRRETHRFAVLKIAHEFEIGMSHNELSTAQRNSKGTKKRKENRLHVPNATDTHFFRRLHFRIVVKHFM